MARPDPTPHPFALTIERSLPLAKQQELALLEKAVAGGAASRDVQARFGELLFNRDRFDEAIAALTPFFDAEHDPFVGVLLAESHLARETTGDDDRAAAVARRALAVASDPQARAANLATLGKALRRMGRIEEARSVLVEALAADPAHVDAFKRLAAIDLAAGAAQPILDTADALTARGVGHARLQVARVMALGMLGRVEAARAAIGLDRFLHRAVLAPPPGWATIAAFNTDLADELMRHPDMRFNRYGTASSDTWRIDNPSIAGSVAVPALQALIEREVHAYVAAIAAHDTSWTRARPAAARLHNWCVMTDAEGFEEWHVHQNGWLSGVYYVDVPPQVTGGDGRGGCLAFGLPSEAVGEDVAAAYGEQLLRPRPGLMALFPSHTYHRTFAHGQDRRRICLAFDIQPIG